MGRLVRFPLRALLLATLGVVPLLAQSGPASATYEVKVRSGLTTGAMRDDLHDTKLMGLAVEGAFPAFGKGAIVVQLDYSYFPGGDYDNMQKTTFDGRTLAVTSSADRRKLQLEGFSGRVGYRAPLFQNADWQVGAALNRFRSQEQVSGTLRPTNATVLGQYESLAYTPEASKLTTSFFAGIKYRLNEFVSLEGNAMAVGFNSTKWQPYWYTGAGTPPPVPVGTVKNETKTGFVFEFAIGLRL